MLYWETVKHGYATYIIHYRYISLCVISICVFVSLIFINAEISNFYQNWFNRIWTQFLERLQLATIEHWCKPESACLFTALSCRRKSNAMCPDPVCTEVHSTTICVDKKKFHFGERDDARGSAQPGIRENSGAANFIFSARHIYIYEIVLICSIAAISLNSDDKRFRCS